jgi:hypothetical protein
LQITISFMPETDLQILCLSKLSNSLTCFLGSVYGQVSIFLKIHKTSTAREATYLGVRSINLTP